VKSGFSFYSIRDLSIHSVFSIVSNAPYASNSSFAINNGKAPTSDYELLHSTCSEISIFVQG